MPIIQICAFKNLSFQHQNRGFRTSSIYCWQRLLEIDYLPPFIGAPEKCPTPSLLTLGTCSFQVKCSEPESENIKLLVERNKIKGALPVRLKLMFLGSNPSTESYKRLELRFGLATFLQESGGKAVGLQIFGQRSCQAWNFLMGKKYEKCFKRWPQKGMGSFQYLPSNIFQGAKTSGIYIFPTNKVTCLVSWQIYKGV